MFILHPFAHYIKKNIFLFVALYGVFFFFVTNKTIICRLQKL